MPVIDGKPLWMFTKLMSVRDLRPWEVEYAPVVVMTVFWVTTNAYADGRRRADEAHEARETPAHQQAKADAARQRKADRQDGFAAAEAAYLAQQGGGDGSV